MIPYVQDVAAVVACTCLILVTCRLWRYMNRMEREMGRGEEWKGE